MLPVDDDGVSPADGGGGVSRLEETAEEEEPDGRKRLRSDAARVLAPPPPLPLRPDREVVRDQVREQLSTTIVVIFLPVAVVVAAAACFSLLPPDLSEMSLGGPVADAREIFSSSNSAGPEARKRGQKLSKS
jgi:hypothetical protein